MGDRRIEEALRHFHPPTGEYPWHGGATVLGALRGVSLEVASWKPYPDRHSIWGWPHMSPTGIMRWNGECYPGTLKTLTSRVSRQGQVRDVAEIPADVRLPGVIMARREGEEHSVRFSSDGPLVTARFEEDAPYEPLLEIGEDGSLAPIGG